MLVVSRDVDAVAPQDARTAATCPLRVHYRADPPGPVRPAPPPAFLQELFDAGRAFEDRVRRGLHATLGERVAVAGDAGQTMAAMASGAEVIDRAVLPDDRVGHRSGAPDLLVRVARRADGRWAYAPVEIKRHRVVQDADRGALGPLRAMPAERLAALDPAALPVQDHRFARRHDRDHLQLSHYHRMLEAVGHASQGVPWAGVLGTEGLVVFHDLSEPRWASWRNVSGRWSSLERYDHEFGFRLDVLAVAHRRLRGEDLKPLVVPARSSECGTCEWREHCEPAMEAADELTLLPRVDWDTRHRLGAQHGVTTRAGLARCDRDALPTAALRDAVDHARVATAADGPYRGRGVTDLGLRRAAVEVDIDMESTADGRVYLWGALLAEPGAAPRYVAHHDFACDLDDVALFGRFWSWLQEMRQAACSAGRSFAAYCYAGPAAEERYLRLYGPQVGADVEALIDSAEWVDLYPVVRDRVVTGRSGNGLKVVAPLAGFAWSDADAGGGNSMAWYADAAAGCPQARQRLLDYNADDVRATRALRDWLQRVWPDLPPVEALAARFGAST